MQGQTRIPRRPAPGCRPPRPVEDGRASVDGTAGWAHPRPGTSRGRGPRDRAGPRPPEAPVRALHTRLAPGPSAPGSSAQRHGDHDEGALRKFGIGQVVRHRIYPFRGVVFDVDPVFANTEEWWLSIPEEVRPTKDQPFYHLFAENAETEYVAYVSEQNLLPDTTGEPLRHPQIKESFDAAAPTAAIRRELTGRAAIAGRARLPAHRFPRRLISGRLLGRGSRGGRRAGLGAELAFELLTLQLGALLELPLGLLLLLFQNLWVNRLTVERLAETGHRQGEGHLVADLVLD